MPEELPFYAGQVAPRDSISCPKPTDGPIGSKGISLEVCCPWRRMEALVVDETESEVVFRPAPSELTGRVAYLRCMNGSETQWRAGLATDHPLYLPEPSGLLVGVLVLLALRRSR